MLAWSEGTDNGRQKTRNHGYDVIVGGELFTDYSDHPRKLITLNQNSNQQAPDATSFFPVGGMPTASSLAWKTTLRKVRTLCGIAARLRSVALYLWLIVVISVRQSTLQQYLGFLPRRWLWSAVRAQADSLIAKFKEAGGTVREIDVWAESPRLSPLWLSASSSAVKRAVNHYRDNAITYKAQRDKNARELKLANAAITDMRCVSVMLLRSMQNTWSWQC